MANILKKTMSVLLDKMLTPALVTGIRAWKPDTMYEIDVYLPKANMNTWKTIHRLKCKVGQLEFRDYTPALWNMETNTCTNVY